MEKAVAGRWPIRLDRGGVSPHSWRMKNTHPILIIGGGHMGGSLATRWHVAGYGPVHVVEQSDTRRVELAALGMACYLTLAEAPKNPAMVVLAIKPQQFEAFAPALKAHIHSESLLVSIMAGVSLTQLSDIAPAVRIMPNLPATVGEGMSVGCAPNLPMVQRTMIADLFAVIGKFVWVDDEDAMHAVTAISGSGPAYVFALMEALERAAAKQGLSPELARLLVTQTVRGAALLADTSADDAATLRRNVTSPGGTTEAALEQFEKHAFLLLVEEAVKAATDRSRQLAQ